MGYVTSNASYISRPHGETAKMYTLSVGGEICRPILYFFYLCIGTNKPMIDAITPRVNIVVENNLY